MPATTAAVEVDTIYERFQEWFCDACTKRQIIGSSLLA